MAPSPAPRPFGCLLSQQQPVVGGGAAGGGVAVSMLGGDRAVGKLCDRWATKLKCDRGAAAVAGGWSVLVTHLIGDKKDIVGCSENRHVFECRLKIN